MSQITSNPALASNSEYRLVSLADRPDLSDAHQHTGAGAWPEFMLHDPVAGRYWDRLMRYFPDYQLSLLADVGIAAVTNTIPLRFDAPLRDLSQRGVDWGVEKSVLDHESGAEPNALLALQVVVNSARRGRGLSIRASGDMLQLAGDKGLQRVIIPVRPVQKHRFPLIPMRDYLAWTDADGLPFDGWLRIHARLGGRTIGICEQSMIIPGTLAQWSHWSGLEFPGSGQYLVDGALNPIEIDVDADRGVYTEPNVWVVYELDGSRV